MALIYAERRDVLADAFPEVCPGGSRVQGWGLLRVRGLTLQGLRVWRGSGLQGSGLQGSGCRVGVEDMMALIDADAFPELERSGLEGGGWRVQGGGFRVQGWRVSEGWRVAVCLGDGWQSVCVCGCDAWASCRCGESR
eukprot:1490483-Rhodomonas_salina.1